MARYEFYIVLYCIVFSQFSRSTHVFTGNNFPVRECSFMEILPPTGLAWKLSARAHVRAMYMALTWDRCVTGLVALSPVSSLTHAMQATQGLKLDSQEKCNAQEVVNGIAGICHVIWRRRNIELPMATPIFFLPQL